MPNSFKWLFDTVQPQPLTHEQRLACIDNSQCQLLVAAAGSGKTSTMVGKVAYSIASGQLKPHEILVLAFNVAAANELSERISNSLFNVLGDETSIKTSTLHALGLQILLSSIADVDDDSGVTNANAGDGGFGNYDDSVGVRSNYKILNDTDNKKLIQKIINKYCKTDIQFADNYLLFLTAYYANFANPDDFVSSYQWRKHVKNNGFILNKLHGFLTLNGELVFSQFEQAIANWLCAHGIKYQYKYAKRTKFLKHVLTRFRFGNLRYQACFVLSEYDIELHCITDNLSEKTIKNKKQSKRSKLQIIQTNSDNDLNIRNKNFFISTSEPKKLFLSANQFIYGALFDNLRRKLTVMGVTVAPINFAKLQKQYSYLPELFLNDYQLDFLQSFIRSYRLAFVDNTVSEGDSCVDVSVSNKNFKECIHNVFNTVEGHDVSISKPNLKQRNTNPIDSNRLHIHSAFLNQICNYYQEYLQQNNLIDFEGMLLDAAQHVRNGRYQSEYKLILVDEFQDTSGASIKLLLALLKQQSDNRIFAVGDDWQSIYGFAGAIPDVMVNFSKYFNGFKCKTNKLSNTFRFNQHIADTASHFIQANPIQIKKQVIAHTPADLNSIKLRYYSSVYAMYLACHQCLLQINNDLENRLNKNNIAFQNNNLCKTDQSHNMPQADNDFVVQETTKHNNASFSVYILGRYKHQQPPELEAWQDQFPRLNIQFSTVHAAKGMQADAVIILGLHTGKYGFPSQVKSDILHSLVSTANDDFPYAQERRLFYVALTRTKGDVYLLAGRRSPSPFIAEVASAILPENII